MNSNNNRFIGVLILILIVIGGYYYTTSKVSVNQIINSLTDTGNPDSIASKVNKALNDDGSTTTSSNTGKTILNEKLNAYVDLLNYVNDNVQSSYERYDLWVDLKNGPSGQEQNVYGLYQLNDESTYFKEADRVSQLEPKIALDTVYVDYKAKYDALKPKADEAYTYYDQENYKDDKMAKGKAMHADLVKAFEDFLTVGDQLSAEYEKIDQVERQKELQAYKDEGRLIAYNSTNVLTSGQQVYFFMREQLSANNNNLSKVSTDDFKKQQDAFEKALDDLKAAVKANPGDVKTEYGNTGDSLMDSYISAGDDYLKSIKSLYRSLRDKSYVERDSFADNTSGTPENLIYTYNNMVDRFNFMGNF